MEGVIELLSHRDDRASRIVSVFVVCDSDDEAKAQGKKTLRKAGLSRYGTDLCHLILVY